MSRSRALLCSTALGGLLAILAAVTSASAQTVIDGDTTVTVPGDRPNPWDLTGLGNDSQLYVGETTGSSRLNIVAGGAVLSSHSYIGFGTGSNGVVTVEGTWTSSYLEVGYRGVGRLDITGGGTVTSSNHSTIGNYSIGTVNVDGTSSSWTISDGLSIGVYHGDGTLNVTHGGTVSTTSDTTAIAIGNGTIPSESDARGTVNVDGLGSTLNVFGPSIIGRFATGTLNITNGGAMSVTAETTGVIAALESGSNGTIKVDGPGSKLEILGYLDVGYLGTASMNITNGGAVSNLNGYIASNSGDATGTVTVDGAGSTWKNNGILYVASQGTGTLTIRNGGLVTATTYAWLGAAGGTGIINIGAAQGDPAAAPGTLNTPTVRLNAHGSLIFNHTDTTGGYSFNPAIIGTGTVVRQIAGITVLTGANTYSGPTNVDGGTLGAGVADTFSPNSAVTVASAGMLDLNGLNQTVPSLTNAGLVNMGTGTPPTTVLTTTNYVGQGGTIAMNTFLGDDTSPSDRLVINSGTASGNSFLHFTNAGGPGALTTANGILVVDAINNGTTDEGAFTLANPELRGGAYDYRLFQGGLNGSDPNNWYLRSTFIEEGGGPPVVPPGELPPEPPTPGPGTFPIIGPEIATYGVVQPMAQQLGRAMLGTHDDRLGDLYRPLCEPAETNAPGYTKAPFYKAPTDCGAYGWRPAVWGRLFGQQIDNHYQAFADPRADGQIAGLQAGVDLLRSDSLFAGHTDYAGFYAAYGNANVDVSGLVTNAAATAFVLQHTGRLNLDGYSGGVYWTHYGVPGWYLDLTLQGTSYNGGASTEFAALKTTGSGFISSLESGYPIALPVLGPGFVLEPQAQVLWQYVSFDSGSDGLGPVALGTSSATTARLGLKGKWTIATDSGQLWQPYVRANVWSDFGPTSTMLFGPDIVPLISHAHYMDVDAGFTTKINAHLSAFAEAGYQFAISNDGGGKRDGVKGTAGLRYQW